MAVAKKKTNVTTELVLGQAAQNLAKAITELKAATENVSKLSDLGEELTLLVSNKEAAIEELEVAYLEKERKLKVDLDLSFKADTDRVVTQYLASINKTAIAESELKELKSELEKTKANAASETKKQVDAVTATLKAQFENDLRFMQAEQKAVLAENASKIGTLADKVKFLEEHAKTLVGQIDAEREAGIERAKAGAIGSINVGDRSGK